MNMKQIRIFATWITVWLTIGCATTDFLGGFNLISPEQELQLGNTLAEDLKKQTKPVEDPEIVQYVQSIGQRLVAVSKNPEEHYNFYVIEDPNVNAFAIPGPHLYVMTGLIAAADNEAELAAVIGHELGHAEHRHPTQQMSRAMGTQILLGIILGENPGALTQIGASLLTQGGLSAYSRSAENEADITAVYLLNRAGYDPMALATFFEKLEALEQQQGGGGVGISLFASHPATEQRILNVRNQIQEFGSLRATKLELVGDFDAIKTKVKALHQ